MSSELQNSKNAGKSKTGKRSDQITPTPD